MTAPTAALVVVGESFLDRDVDGYVDRVAPDAPVPVLEVMKTLARPGAAAHAAVWAARDAQGRHPVVLLTALAADAGGGRIRTLAEDEGVEVVDLGWSGQTTEKVRIRGNSQPLLRLDRGTTSGAVLRPHAAAEHVKNARTVLVSDYGRGLVGERAIRSALASAARRAPVVWDPHVRGSDPIRRAAVLTPNIAELAHAAGGNLGADIGSIRAVACNVLARLQPAAVAVTMAERGVLLVTAEGARVVTPPRVRAVDTCGAGDRFAAALAVQLFAGATLDDAVDDAVALAGAYVASDLATRQAPVGAAFDDEGATVAVVHSARARGLRVVATSGCFDLIHPGHTRFLEEARSRGDMLVVLLNSDDSVRRLKGAGRPVNSARDRAAVLRSLASVDAVVIFHEDTPADILRRIKPSLFVKGGDYRAPELPEYGALLEIGTEVEVLRYWAGYSTTTLIASVRT